MPLQPGARLGPYEIVSAVGAGGMGEVYKARDPRLDRIVAVKQLNSRHSARFEREARAIAALNHPHICQIYDIGPDYLVMEYVDGQPVRGPLAVEEAVRLALQIAGALEEAHGRGILHRDLKPGNILVTRKGAAKLLDFGLAKLMTDADPDITKTVEGTIMGTAAYMAPEQAEGKPLDARADVFSFGAVLYEMLSGNRAFGGRSTVQVLSAVLRDDPSPLHAPAELQRIVMKCLAKDPSARFSSMGELRLALEQMSVKTVDRQPSIAVLPFANLSPDKENEYFSDGLAEEILNLLAKIPGLKVIARTSAFAFRGKDTDIRDIAKRLHVRTILEGSVRRAGNRIRVTAQLINGDDESHLWSERYDRELTDIFAIQDEIGQAISEALKIRLAPRARSVNIEAYQLYLKGQYYRVRFTPESLAKAKQCFDQALAIDPSYPPAYSGLAGYYLALITLGMKPVGDVAPLAKSAAEKALAIDSGNSEANSVVAAMAAVFEYDWNAAERYYGMATASETVPPFVRYRYLLYFLLPLGRIPAAMEQCRLALEVDPLSMVLHVGMTLCLLCAKQYREAIEYARKALEIDSNHYFSWFALGQAQLSAGFSHEATTSLSRVMELAPWYLTGAGFLAGACHQAGDHESCQEWRKRLADARGHHCGAAVYYAIAGEVEAMFDALEVAHRERDYFLLYIPHLPFFDPYRADPRYQALLRRINLA